MLYYNLGILGSDNESLRLAVKLLYESGANPILAMRWNLQMAAISSSYNQYE